MANIFRFRKSGDVKKSSKKSKSTSIQTAQKPEALASPVPDIAKSEQTAQDRPSEQSNVEDKTSNRLSGTANEGSRVTSLVAGYDVDTPDAQTPKVQNVEEETLLAGNPQVEPVEAEIAKAELPEAEIPEAEIPEAEIPETEISKGEIPEAEIPKAEIPKGETSEAEIPDLKDPNIKGKDAEELGHDIPANPPDAPLPASNQDVKEVLETKLSDQSVIPQEEPPKPLAVVEKQEAHSSSIPTTSQALPVQVSPATPVQAQSQAQPRDKSSQKSESAKMQGRPDKNHVRHDSAIESTPAQPPKRSSSVRNAFQAYYRIFGGKPNNRSAPKNELPKDELERLRKLTRTYERQLEEASNTIILQDKVLVRWEKHLKKSLSRGSKAKEVHDDPTSSHLERPVSVDGQASVVSAEDGDRGLDGQGRAQRLSMLAESSKEKLNEMLAQPTSPQETEELKKKISSLTAELESSKKELKAAKATQMEHETKIKSLEQESAKATEALKTRVASLETELSEARSNTEKNSSDFAKHRETSAKELGDALQSHKSSTLELEALRATLQETQKSHKNAISDLESAKTEAAEKSAYIDRIIAEKAELITTHEAALSQKDKELGVYRQQSEDALKQEETAKKHAVQLAASVDSLTNHKKESASALEEARIENQKLKAAVKDVTSGHQATKDELTSLRAATDVEKDARSKDLEASKLQVLELRNAVDGHLKSKAELQQQIESLKSVKSDLEAANARIANLSASAEGHDASKRELETTKQQLEEFEKASKTHAATTAELGAANAKIVELTKSLETHTGDKAELEATKTKAADLSKEIENHKLIKSDLAAAQGQIVDLEKAIEKKNAESGEAQGRLTAAEAQLAVAIKESKAHLSNLEAKHAELSKTQQELSSAQTAIQTAEHEHKSEKETIEVKLEGAHQENEKLLKELESTKSSRSAGEASLAKAHQEMEDLRKDHKRLGDLVKNATTPSQDLPHPGKGTAVIKNDPATVESNDSSPEVIADATTITSTKHETPAIVKNIATVREVPVADEAPVAEEALAIEKPEQVENAQDIKA